MRSALAVPLLRNSRTLGVITLAHESPEHFTEAHLQILIALGAQAAMAIENTWLSHAGAERQLKRQRTHEAAAGPAEQLLLPSGASPEDRPPRPPDSQNVVAVSVALRGFSAASEQLAPEVLVGDVLDIYLHTMTEVIQHYTGYMDKSSDCSILALFGHPEHQHGDALRAVQAALSLHRAATRLRANWRARFGIDLGVAIGIGHGQVAVGRVGSPGRHDYPVIGAAVNQANRLQSVARLGEILIAAELMDTLNGAGDRFAVEALPPLPAQGRHSIQYVYRVVAPAINSGLKRPHHQPKWRPASSTETTP
jgi:adenylate cyclase